MAPPANSALKWASTLTRLCKVNAAVHARYTCIEAAGEGPGACAFVYFVHMCNV